MPTSLEEYGFRPAGTWRLKSTVGSGIGYELVACAAVRVLYAFVIDNRAMYVGVCEKDTTTLKARMGRYQAMQGNSTNRRVASLIRECLEKGNSVGILAIQPSDEGPRYRSLTIDLVKGLENPLIRALNPPWNRGAPSSVSDDPTAA